MATENGVSGRMWKDSIIVVADSFELGSQAGE
jgi:hypothetical protein